MGEDITPAGEHFGSVVEGAGHVDVLGTNLHFAGYPTADAGRRKEVCAGRQDLAGHHEECLQRAARSRYHRDREDAGASEKELWAVGINSKRSEWIFGEEETLLPQVLLPLQRRAAGDSLRDERSDTVSHL